MKNKASYVTTLCEIGIFAALGFVFDELQSILFRGLFPSGGSIGFAMIAVLIVAYRRGFLPAFLTGLLMGLFDIATSAYILHPAQVLLDYILPYALVGFVGLLKPLLDKASSKSSKIIWLLIGTLLGGTLKFLSHYFSGAFFFSDPRGFNWGLETLNPFLYSFVYNIAFMGPCTLITGALIVPLYLKAPHIFVVQEKQNEEEKVNREKVLPMSISICLIALGLFVFVFYLVKYINSFSEYTDSYYETSVYGYDFDGDSMLIFILGLFTAVLGTNSLIKTILNKFSYTISFGVLSFILLSSLIYDISRLIKMYIKEKDPTTYWIWFFIGLISLSISIFLFVYASIKQKKEKELDI